MVPAPNPFLHTSCPVFNQGGTMKLYLDFIRRQMGLAGVLCIGYSALLFFLIWQYNADSMIYYQISPYAYASDPIDFFFGLLVSIPFAFGLFYLKKITF